MATPKFFTPFAENDNFNATVEASEETNQLFIVNRILRGEHVTQKNSGVSEDEWSTIMSKLKNYG